MTKSANPPTHYDILNLPPSHHSAETPTSASIKLAYHRALLLHHPDKPNRAPNKNRYTVDEISLAYRTLSDAASRTSYDSLLLSRQQKAPEIGGDGAPGGEIVDLEDLEYDDAAEIWYRSCRCGQERGFKVTEEDLEKAVREDVKEVVVGCGGCSLHIKVLFDWVDGG